VTKVDTADGSVRGTAREGAGDTPGELPAAAAPLSLLQMPELTLANGRDLPGQELAVPNGSGVALRDAPVVLKDGPVARED